jgi:hypothetical protein
VGGDTGLVECEQDCAGNWGGDLVYDECDVCGGDSATNPNCSCCDCAGVPNGTAELDCADVCNGNTPDIDEDEICDDVDPCVGVYDECEVCNGDNYFGEDDLLPNGDCDCNGSVNDECGVCNGPGGTSECGCFTVAEEYGNGFDGDTTIGNYCNCFGSIVDACGDCGGDGPAPCYDCEDNCICGYDCNDVCGGTAGVDECGDCDGDGPGFYEDCAGNCPEDLERDCNGICGGTDVEDTCGVCGGDNSDCSGCMDVYASKSKSAYHVSGPEPPHTPQSSTTAVPPQSPSQSIPALQPSQS